MHLVLKPADMERIQACLRPIHGEPGIKSVLLIDRSGLLISDCGDISLQEATVLAALCTANFEATAELARMMGEKDFCLLFHKGRNENVHLYAVGKELLLVTIFGNESSVGAVRLLVKHAAEDLIPILPSS
jgi:predicted regulator of Ras-like GTPase activity (Roadblock/LC7/MglB family)